MKAMIFAVAILVSAAPSYAATYDNIGSTNAPSSGNSAQKQINDRIKKSDKLNEIDSQMNKYKNSDKPADRFEYQQYQKEKNQETFKRN